MNIRTLITGLVIILSDMHASAQQAGFHYKAQSDHQKDPAYSYRVRHTTDNGKTPNDSSWLTGYPRIAISQSATNGTILKLNFKRKDIKFIEGYSQKPFDKIKLGDSSFFFYRIKKKPVMDSPDLYISIPFSMLDIGAVTIPIKYRLGKTKSGADTSDFSTTANIGIYLGYKFGHTRFFEDPSRTSDRWVLEPSIFVSPLSITETDTAQGAGGKNATRNIFGLSTGAAFLLTTKGATAGIFCGRDWEVAHLNQFLAWPWRKRLWIGAGVGFNLTSFGSKNTKQQ